MFEKAPLRAKSMDAQRECSARVHAAGVLKSRIGDVYIPISRMIYRRAGIMAAAEMLKVAEAAAVSRVALRDVNRAIDEGILPDGFFAVDNGRRVLPAACTLISFYFESADRLTAEERLFTIRMAGPRLRKRKVFVLPTILEEDWTVQHEFLTIDLAPFVKGTAERLERLAAARNMVTSSPDILGGTLVIRGTRIPVHDVAASLAAGLPMDRIIAAYPALDAEKVELAALFAEANPMRGRPRAAGELPKGTDILSDRRVPRRKAG